MNKLIVTTDYKDNWKIVETALNKSDGFDAAKCKVAISKSEKEQLSVSFFRSYKIHHPKEIYDTD